MGHPLIYFFHSFACNARSLLYFIACDYFSGFFSSLLFLFVSSPGFCCFCFSLVFFISSPFFHWLFSFLYFYCIFFLSFLRVNGFCFLSWFPMFSIIFALVFSFFLFAFDFLCFFFCFLWFLCLSFYSYGNHVDYFV